MENRAHCAGRNLKEANRATQSSVQVPSALLLLHGRTPTSLSPQAQEPAGVPQSLQSPALVLFCVCLSGAGYI